MASLAVSGWPCLIAGLGLRPEPGLPVAATRAGPGMARPVQAADANDPARPVPITVTSNIALTRTPHRYRYPTFPTRLIMLDHTVRTFWSNFWMCPCTLKRHLFTKSLQKRLFDYLSEPATLRDSFRAFRGSELDPLDPVGVGGWGGGAVTQGEGVNT
jgi:hypothetical protein